MCFIVPQNEKNKFEKIKSLILQYLTVVEMQAIKIGIVSGTF
jgi:hypothetical protein